MNKKIYILMALVLSSIFCIKAQDNRQYSMYGYGLLSDRATSMQRQMGSIGYAMHSGRQINVMNPASYAAIDSLTFLFDIGADMSVIWQKQINPETLMKEKESRFGGGLDYITMQFPIWKYIGASIGLVPYSYVGYAFGTDIEHGAMSNQGEGGINQAYIGVAGTYAGFSLGLNVSYDFGNIINDVFTTVENSGQTLYEHVMQVRDWDIVLGAQYTTKIAKTERLNLGLTFSPKKSIHGKTWVTKQETIRDSEADTVAFMKMKGKYFTPMSVGAGIGWVHERASRWMVEFDFTYQQWSKATYSPLYADDDPDNMVFEGMNFKDRTRYSLGGEFVPKIRGNYFQRMAYRAGVYYNNDYLNIDGNHLKEYGVTAGFGFNTPEGKTMINLGFEWKHRKATPNPLITENFFNITLGINFNELWFWQRKIR
ncbi:MAG: hypothetical protein J1F16_05155 [Muribaculaceae bacterium]|nr:hypothetical protein [Muribaculaceae bacterium]